VHCAYIPWLPNVNIYPNEKRGKDRSSAKELNLLVCQSGFLTMPQEFRGSGDETAVILHLLRRNSSPPVIEFSDKSVCGVFIKISILNKFLQKGRTI
jgi:hypothetical protein